MAATVKTLRLGSIGFHNRHRYRRRMLPESWPENVLGEEVGVIERDLEAVGQGRAQHIRVVRTWEPAGYFRRAHWSKWPHQREQSLSDPQPPPRDIPREREEERAASRDPYEAAYANQTCGFCELQHTTRATILECMRVYWTLHGLRKGVKPKPSEVREFLTQAKGAET